MNYQLKQMSGEDAKKILQSLLKELSGIDVDDLTGFDLGVIRQCAANYGKLPRRGKEELIIDGNGRYVFPE